MLNLSRPKGSDVLPHVGCRFGLVKEGHRGGGEVEEKIVRLLERTYIRESRLDKFISRFWVGCRVTCTSLRREFESGPIILEIGQIPV